MTVRSATIAPHDRGVGETAVWVGALLVSVAVGVAVNLEPSFALVPVAALLAALLLVNGAARVLFVVLGGLLVFQRGQELDMTKVGFLALFAVALSAAFLNLRTMRSSPSYQLARPLLIASVAFAALAVVSLVVAHNNATPLVSGWLRDLAPYVLFISAPIFALDAQASLSRRALVALLVAAGTVGALAFAVSWLDRRGIADLGASSIGLATYLLPAALFSYAMSMVLHARRTIWLWVAGMVLALLLVTGTRTNLVLLVAPIAIALGAHRARAMRFVRLVFVGPLAVAVTALVLLAVVSVSNVDTGALTERVALLGSTGGSTDYSYTERVRETRAASDVFTSNVVLGAGPGTAFNWERVNGTQVSSFTLDTPLTFPAKFGLLGLVALVFVVARYWSFLRSLLRARGPTVESFALIGYLAVVAVSTLALSPFEEKGFSFGLMLLLALALSEVNARSTTASAPSRHAPTGARDDLPAPS